MSKAKVYYKQKASTLQSTQEVYNKCLKALKKKRGTTKKLCPPQEEPDQSTKSTTKEGPESKYNLDQA